MEEPSGTVPTIRRLPPNGKEVAVARPLRADARRNYDRLLAAGEEAFTEHGPDASLEDIARRAGVGIGTLYRHFPTRQALLEAAYLDRVEALRALAVELVTADTSTVDALVTWVRALAEHIATYRGLKGLLMAEPEADPALSTVHDTLREAAGSLLDRAQADGSVRPDLTVAELLRLTHGLLLVAELTAEDTGAQVDRLLSLLLTGITAPSQAPIRTGR
jgi:AcrR family transcriptional regulator